MSDRRFEYKLRPVYHSEEFLLEFDGRDLAAEFEKSMNELLIANGFAFVETADTPITEDIELIYSGKIGHISVFRNNWDFFFILGKDNQQDILDIAQLLEKDERFMRLPFDPELYL